MKVPFEWLKEYANTELSAEEVAAKLTLGGLEVEAIEEVETPEGKLTVLETSPTSNRGDLLSLVGVAREVHALCGAEFTPPLVQVEEVQEPASKFASLEVLDAVGCPRYTARILLEVEVKPSPEWLQAKLLAAGVRPINNVVDVTNYVLLELGQPLHAFDLDELEGAKIVVRRAQAGEKLETLDGITRELDEDCLVIADANRPVALAGIMGGEDSGVTEKTTRVVLESAHFKPQLIRATAKRFTMSTEASYRFERYVDVNGTLQAVDRACQLLCEIAGAKVATGALEFYPEPVEAKTLELRPDRCEQLLGIALSPQEQQDILEALGFKVTPGARLKVTVPTFRHDITREVDLLEELVRVYGYDKLEETLPAIGGVVGGESAKREFVNQVRQGLAAAGLCEMQTFSLTSPRELEAVKAREFAGEAVPVTNAMSEEYSVLRPTLLGGLVREIAYNLHRQQPEAWLFEVDRVFKPGASGEVKEPVYAGIALTGGNYTAKWNLGPCAESDVYELKGIIEELLDYLQVFEVTFEPAELPFARPGYGAKVKAKGQEVGYIAELSDEVKQAFEVEQAVFVAELDVEALFEARSETRPYKRPAAFPKSERDLALVAPVEVSCAQLVEVVKAEGGELLEDVTVFDVFEGKSLGEGKRSLAVRLSFRHPERTLTEEEINPVVERIVRALGERYQASLRQ